MSRATAVTAFIRLNVDRSVSPKKRSSMWKAISDSWLGDAAIRAMAKSMRAFAHERPGLSAATFRTPLTDTPVWRREGELLQEAALAVFARAGLGNEKGVTALRILRAIVRGFVLHEMAASFLDDVDYDSMFDVTISVFIRGLDEIRAPSTSDAEPICDTE